MDDAHPRVADADLHAGVVPRAARTAVERDMRIFPVVVVRGPRQAGKSTLVSGFDEGTRVLRSFDDPATRALFHFDQDAFLRSDTPMTLDEAQREPAVMLALKRAVDAMQHRRVYGKYLVTGSANLLMMKQVADSLAGRASYVTLWPLTRRERLGLGTTGAWTHFLEQPPAEWPALAHRDKAPKADWRAEVLRGGFPEPALALSDPRDRDAWHVEYLKTYLDRDLRDVASVESVLDFRALMQAAALRTGNLVNQTELGRDVQMSQPRVRGYLNVMEISYQLVRLPAFVASRRKRLIKAPKLYWNDPALALHLAGEHEPRGAHFENLVLLDILAWAEVQGRRPEIGYWRTAEGIEVDFVIEASRRVLPIEVKTGRRVVPNDAKGLRLFLAENAGRASGGLLLYGGDETFWVAEGVLALPWWKVI